jgi:hypothetical protein
MATRLTRTVIMPRDVVTYAERVSTDRQMAGWVRFLEFIIAGLCQVPRRKQNIISSIKANFLMIPSSSLLLISSDLNQKYLSSFSLKFLPLKPVKQH